MQCRQWVGRANRFSASRIKIFQPSPLISPEIYTKNVTKLPTGCYFILCSISLSPILFVVVKIKKKSPSNFIIIANFHVSSSPTIAKFQQKVIFRFVGEPDKWGIISIRHLWVQRNKERASKLPYFDISCRTPSLSRSRTFTPFTSLLFCDVMWWWWFLFTNESIALFLCFFYCSRFLTLIKSQTFCGDFSENGEKLLKSANALLFHDSISQTGCRNTLGCHQRTRGFGDILTWIFYTWECCEPFLFWLVCRDFSNFKVTMVRRSLRNTGLS